MRNLFSILFFILWGSASIAQTDTTFIGQDTSIVSNLSTDNRTGSIFLDSLSQGQNMRRLFFINERIVGEAKSISKLDLERNLPGIKSIRYRLPSKENWKFWVVASSLLFLSLIRISNPKRFDEQLLSAIDFSIDLKFSSEKTGSYLFNHIGLFVTFIIALSLFWVTYLEYHSLEDNVNYSLRIWQQVGILLALYLGKTFTGMLIGWVFEMKAYTKVFLYNTLVVNNFLGVLMVFFNLFYIYVQNPETLIIIESILLILIFIAIIFRTIKNILMSLQAGSEQIIYIILYLCSLEIVPWLILLKLFINGR